MPGPMPGYVGSLRPYDRSAAYLLASERISLVRFGRSGVQGTGFPHMLLQYPVSSLPPGATLLSTMLTLCLAHRFHTACHCYWVPLYRRTLPASPPRRWCSTWCSTLPHAVHWCPANAIIFRDRI